MKFTIYKSKISVSTVIFIKYTLKENIKKDYTNPVWKNALLYNLLSRSTIQFFY